MTFFALEKHTHNLPVRLPVHEQEELILILTKKNKFNFKRKLLIINLAARAS